MVFVSPLAISGTAADALSGLTSISCNGAPGVMNGANFSCNVTLAAGANSIAVTAADLAGNTAQPALL